jgi:TolA-binding protein
VELRLGPTAIRVADAKATVTAKTGAIASVVVFAGSVALSSGVQSTVVMAGNVWVASKTSDRAGSMAAFQAGWAALRRGNFAIAIAEFDRARDPVIREEAAFWAAIAARRAGHRDAAHRRFVEFLENFPFSSRADAARREIAADRR